MKKIMVFAFALCATLLMFAFPRAEVAAATPETLVIHYYRYAADYTDGWNVWIWAGTQNGQALTFDSDESGFIYDSWGVTVTLDLTDVYFQDITEIGIIFRQGEWVKKDVDKDRYI